MGVIIITLITAFLCIYDIISVGMFIFVSFGSYLWMIVGSVLYFKLGWFKVFYHDFLHWHAPDDSPYYCDGLTEHATCKWCGKDIMQDSQGNWF